MNPTEENATQWRSGRFKNREEWLDNLFARDPEKLWPTQRVFMPIWREAGKLQAVIRIDEDDIPEGCFADGERPKGEIVEPFDVHHGLFHPVSEDYVREQQMVMALSKKKSRKTRGLKSKTKKHD